MSTYAKVGGGEGRWGRRVGQERPGKGGKQDLQQESQGRN